MTTKQSKGEVPGRESKRAKGIEDIRLASVTELLATAAEVVKASGCESKLLNTDIEELVPKFSDREISTGGIIGRGGFCVVRDIDKIRVPHRSNSFRSNKSSGTAMVDASSVPVRGFGGIFGLCSKARDLDDLSYSGKSVDGSLHSELGGKDVDDTKAYRYTREYVAQRSKKTRRNGGRYVLKSVNKEVDKITYMKGNVDIAMEAKFLSVLNHANIIDLVGVSRSKPCTPGYFLILEKMTETLGSRIKRWMDRERMCQGIFGHLSGGKRKEAELYHERIAASYDIANGLYYLHSKNIVYRDLKPANIGFDCRDQLKIFDFGLAKELKEQDLRQDGTYRNMTAMTGAIRYMAPEVGLGHAYNLSADVYSWSMVMWFILALEPPFGFFTESMISTRVHTKGVRPAIFRRWNEVLGEILRCAWDPDLHNRPNFLEITLVLKQELIDTEQAGAGSTAAGSSKGSVVDGTDQGGISQGEDSDDQNQQTQARTRRGSNIPK